MLCVFAKSFSHFECFNCAVLLPRLTISFFTIHYPHSITATECGYWIRSAVIDFLKIYVLYLSSRPIRLRYIYQNAIMLVIARFTNSSFNFITILTYQECCIYNWLCMILLTFKLEIF